MPFLAFLATILFISDVQIDMYDAYPESIATIVVGQIGDHLVYDCGDLVEHAYSPEYATYAALFPQVIAVPGNHDWYNDLFYYEYDQMVDVMDEGLHLVGMDTSLRRDSSAMEWLGTTLDDGSTFTVFFTHYPMYSDNVRNGGMAATVREWFLPTLDATQVELVISGHGHAYERHVADGRTYLVIGGAGAHLDEVGFSDTQVTSASLHHYVEITRSGQTVNVLVRGIDGGVVDLFAIDITTPTETKTWGQIKHLYR
ncbi:MAG: metallophosphoesterase [bacterium]